MKVVFRQEWTRYLELHYMAHKLLNNNVYCAENGLDDVLEKLKKLKDF